MSARRSAVLLLACWLGMACIAAGCSRPGPTRFRLEGTVSFKGKPVPAGRLMLAPDGTQGNRGPAAYAEIVDGRFTTVKGKGHVGGPHVVEIQGFQALRGTDMPSSLFPTHETVVDLPRADSSWEYAVPTDAGRKPAARPAAAP